jgi:pyruvate/2-oxoglutarate/acetoin dehydrogenase E1 component
MVTTVESLNLGLHRAFAEDERVYLLGEDILDPYGGAFKVTRGLSSAYPERVLTTPISEAGITGMATGMALRGLRPVVEIMFGDFLPLIADQITNHIAKFSWMYNEQVRVPLVIRTPMGGRRGYGPTHSQTLEKLFLGIPGIKTLALTTLGNPGEQLYDAILKEDNPVLFIENKLLYLRPVFDELDAPDISLSAIPNTNYERKDIEGEVDSKTYLLAIRDAPHPSLTIAAYGYMAELAREAAVRLAYEHEIFSEVLVFTQLSPFEIAPLLTSIEKTGRLLVLEEGTYTMGWGAEVVARAAEAIGPKLRQAHRLAALDLPVPASGPLEKAVLPDVDRIVQSAKMMV